MILRLLLPCLVIGIGLFCTRATASGQDVREGTNATVLDVYSHGLSYPQKDMSTSITALFGGPENIDQQLASRLPNDLSTESFRRLAMSGTIRNGSIPVAPILVGNRLVGDALTDFLRSVNSASTETRLLEIQRLNSLGVQLKDGHFSCVDPTAIENHYEQSTTDSLVLRRGADQSMFLDAHLVVRFHRHPADTGDTLRNFRAFYYYMHWLAIAQAVRSEQQGRPLQNGA